MANTWPWALRSARRCRSSRMSNRTCHGARQGPRWMRLTGRDRERHTARPRALVRYPPRLWTRTGRRRGRPAARRRTMVSTGTERRRPMRGSGAGRSARCLHGFQSCSGSGVVSGPRARSWPRSIVRWTGPSGPPFSPAGNGRTDGRWTGRAMAATAAAPGVKVSIANAWGAVVRRAAGRRPANAPRRDVGRRMRSSGAGHPFVDRHHGARARRADRDAGHRRAEHRRAGPPGLTDRAVIGLRSADKG